jgi:hypothetical protein
MLPFLTNVPVSIMALLAPRSLESVPTQTCKALLLCLLTVMTLATPHAAQRGPDVVVIAEEDQMVYEFRQNGQLRMIRVVPSFGKPYYLVPKDPTQAGSDLRRVESLVPSWVLWEFK